MALLRSPAPQPDVALAARRLLARSPDNSCNIGRLGRRCSCPKQGSLDRVQQRMPPWHALGVRGRLQGSVAEGNSAHHSCDGLVWRGGQQPLMFVWGKLRTFPQLFLSFKCAAPPTKAWMLDPINVLVAGCTVFIREQKDTAWLPPAKQRGSHVHCSPRLPTNTQFLSLGPEVGSFAVVFYCRC